MPHSSCVKPDNQSLTCLASLLAKAFGVAISSRRRFSENGSSIGVGGSLITVAFSAVWVAAADLDEAWVLG
jgi:hypothetical protein